MTDRIKEFREDWAAAELPGDPDRLSALVANDFCGVGPLGFILNRSAWLGRHTQRLAYDRFSLDEVQVRPCGDVAVITARNDVSGTYRSQPLPEALRATLVITTASEASRLAAIHLSFVAGTKGSPPVPAPASSPDRDAAEPAHREER